MPKLPDQHFRVEAKDGRELKVSVKVSVLGDGLFSIEVPEELGPEMLRTHSRDLHEVSRGQYRFRVPNLADGLKLLREAAQNYIDVKEERRLVIAYHVGGYHAMWRDNDGTLHPNGEHSHHEKGSWLTPRLKSFDSISSHQPPAFAIRLGAYVVDLVTFTRPNGKTWMLVRVEDDEDLPPDAQYLNRFSGIYPATLGRTYSREEDLPPFLPYSDRAAQFMAESLTGLNQLAMRLDEFFSQPDLIAAIESPTGPNLIAQ